MFELSVVMVSDHGAGGDESHAEWRATLGALAAQEASPKTEYLLIENQQLAGQLPEELCKLVPSLRIIRSQAVASYELKNEGVRAASAEVVVMLDADCQPGPNWLTRIAAAWKRYPDAAAISGHTQYEGRTARDRILALLGRSFLHPGGAGPTEFVSNSNASWKREVFLAHPLPEGLGPFAGRMQSEQVRRSGGRFYFDPAIRVTHAFEGWEMEVDIRRNIGYGTVIMRLHDAAMPHAGLVRLGRAAIPLIVAGKTWNSWADCLRCYRHFGLDWWEASLALLAAPVLIALETPGMWLAYARHGGLNTTYR